MWANAQHDGRPTEYRWRPLFNATKFGWRPLLDCRAVTLPRRETRWNSQGCSKLTKRSEPLVGQSSPYYGYMWRRYCCLTSFFLIVDTCLSCEDIAQQSCGMVPRWRLFGDFFVSWKKKKERRRNHRMKIYMACPITQGSHKQSIVQLKQCNVSNNKNKIQHTNGIAERCLVTLIKPTCSE